MYVVGPMPIVCVIVPEFRLGVARLADPTVPRSGALLVADRFERGRVIECSAAAAALGVRPGTTRVAARAAARDARVVLDDPGRDNARWQQMLDALDAASPVVDDAGLGCAYLEMHGIDGGAARWLAVVRDALAPFELPVRVGLADNPFVARAAALISDGTRIDPGAAAAFLAPLSLDLLDIDAAALERLRFLGVRTLGDVAALPHGPFVRRFGTAGAQWHDRARGIDPRPLRPRARALRIDRRLYGEGTAVSEDQVLFALRMLVGQVAEDLDAAGKRCGALALDLECEDGDIHQITTRVAAPTATPATLFELLRARLEGLVLHSPVAGLRLAAQQLEDGGIQLSLFARSDPDPTALGIALARLDAALGERQTLRARVIDGARPESRFCLEPFSLDIATSASGQPWAGATDDGSPVTAGMQFQLIEPTPVDVLMRSGLPQFIGSPPQAILDVAGPWRSDESWWTTATGGGTPIARDEYDVLLEDGALMRIAREGTHWSIRGRYD
jgi:protein ImuB